MLASIVPALQAFLTEAHRQIQEIQTSPAPAATPEPAPASADGTSAAAPVPAEDARIVSLREYLVSNAQTLQTMHQPTGEALKNL